MRIPKTTLTCLAAEGRITLQVPEFVVGDIDGLECEETPDDWLHAVRYAGGKLRECCGKETGFTHFTRKGFLAMRERLRAAYEGSGPNMRGFWPEFESHAANEFESIRRTTFKRIKLLRKQADELEAKLQGSH